MFMAAAYMKKIVEHLELAPKLLPAAQRMPNLTEYLISVNKL